MLHPPSLQMHYGGGISPTAMSALSGVPKEVSGPHSLGLYRLELPLQLSAFLPGPSGKAKMH